MVTIDKDYYGLVADENFYALYSDLYIKDDVVVQLDKELIIYGNLETSGSFESMQTVTVHGYTNCEGIDIRGALLCDEWVLSRANISAININSGGFVEATGNINVGGKICANGNIASNGNITASGAIVGNINIIADGFISAIGAIVADCDICSKSYINANLGLNAGGKIEAGEYIKSSNGIVAGEQIAAGDYIFARCRIFAGISMQQPTDACNKTITCKELRKGEICFGELILI